MRVMMRCARPFAMLALLVSSACSDDPGSGVSAGEDTSDDSTRGDLSPPTDATDGDGAGTDGDASLDASDDTGGNGDVARDVFSIDAVEDSSGDTAAGDAEDDRPSDDDATADGADDAPADAGDDTPDVTHDVADGGELPCEYPIVWTPEPGVEEAAAAALATLAPGADLTWVDQRGTFQRLGNLNLVIDCADDEDLWPHLYALVDENPDIFQMDSSEWVDLGVLNCENVPEFPNRILTWNRLMMGGERALRDIVTFTLSRVEGEVTLKSVFGAYLPLPPEPITDAMAACPDLELAAARAAALSDTFDYTVFEFCVETGFGTYTPTQDDAVVLDETHYWGWADDVAGGTVILTKEHVGGLILHPDNVTPELISSDAWCPDEEGEFSAGWDIIFDAVLTTLLSKMPGFGPCIVCFK